MIKRFNDQTTAKFKNVFNKFDLDCSGQISSHELKTALGKLGIEMTADDIDRIVKSLDFDASGQLNFPEFLEFIYRSSRH
jgi:Ca2+-binding EF-hand superfamily protein